MNFKIEFLGAYFLLGADMTNLPEIIEMDVTSLVNPQWSTTLALPPAILTFSALRKRCPFPLSAGKKKQSAIDDILEQRFMTWLQNNPERQGYYLDTPGVIWLPSGRIVFLRGGELLGECGRPYYVAPELRKIRLLGNDDPPTQFCALLANCQLPALLAVAYAAVSSIRSILLDNSVDFQAVLYITGDSGNGKTTLARRAFETYLDTDVQKSPCVVQAGASAASLESKMLAHRDQSLVVDDLCLSSSTAITRKHRDLGSQMVRYGAGDIPISKRKGASVIHISCAAGIVLTAEFALDRMSDLTRCLMVPIDEHLHLPDELTSELMGSVIRWYSRWFAQHSDDELQRFEDAVRRGKENCELEPRMSTNYECLREGFFSLLRSFQAIAPEGTLRLLAEQMNKAIDLAQKAHLKYIDHVNAGIPQGTLAEIILAGYRQKCFRLAGSIKKLETHDGIIWGKDNDLCLRPEALVSYVRSQNGYHDWGRNRITRALADLGALVLQEDGSYTVHLEKSHKGKPIPRVYRIRLSVLEKATKKED